MRRADVFRLRWRLAVTVVTGVAVVATLLWMLIAGDYRLWAWVLALLCLFAVALRGYAFEWRRQRDAARGEEKR